MESLHESIKRVLNEDPLDGGINTDLRHPPNTGGPFPWVKPYQYGNATIGTPSDRYNYPQYQAIPAGGYTQLRNPQDAGVGTRQYPGRRIPYQRGSQYPAMSRRSPYLRGNPYSNYYQ